MILYLENTSKNKVITLRYGEGNNKILQLNPGENKPLPVEITKYKLKTYLPFLIIIFKNANLRE